ncbi:radical SAM protein [Geobacter sp. DSM 9736]|uniref:B12-binding domain-containing radical SAM protein n=1 Tax=Geobacter sp. DSM 9736 TaxID=1277350 RepID=UPI000B500E95|nr:radical SAM protein [Geobacter sp. DSM 9736]SNB47010.1 Radical SAM superfamily enzyme YgiQ, UPF0313 family [Geobacter sp. DSM 9736]
MSETNKFNVMLVSVNDRMRTLIPLNLSYLIAALKQADFHTCVFDTSFYVEQERLQDERKKEEAGIFMPVDYESIGVRLKTTSLVDDLLEFVRTKRPNLIGFTVFSQAKDLNFRLASAIKERFPEIPIIMGGIHINIEPTEVLQEAFVDYICVGEGDEAIVDLATRLATGKSVTDCPNIWGKADGAIWRNPPRPPLGMDELPLPDWDSFDSYHLYGPFRGKLYKMGVVEFSRNCPYRCTYCGNDIMRAAYREVNIQLKYRHKSPKRWVEELKIRKEKYGIEMFYVADGTFLAAPDAVIEELADLYAKEVSLPFFCDATVHCITDRKVAALKKMGCICVHMGMESGNEAYRKKFLDRSMTNEKILKAFWTVRDAGIETRSYNIIGLPNETREDIMKTIELNRQAKVDSVSLAIFTPYEGTKLRQFCLDNGLLDPDRQLVGDATDPMIHNPLLSDQELVGLYNTFALYVSAPESYFPLIRQAEEHTAFANELRKSIAQAIADLQSPQNRPKA